jgi:hypothetical protein
MPALGASQTNMVSISIEGDQLHLEVKGLDKLWAFKSQLNYRFGMFSASGTTLQQSPAGGMASSFPARAFPACSQRERFINTDGAYFGTFTILRSPSGGNRISKHVADTA